MSRIFVFAASKSEADPLARLVGASRWDTPNHAGPITAGPNQLEFFITGTVPEKPCKMWTRRDVGNAEKSPKEIICVEVPAYNRPS